MKQVPKFMGGKCLRTQAPELLSALGILLLISLSSIAIGFAESTSSFSCAKAVHSQIQDITSSLDTSRAISIATGYSEFRSITAGNKVTFNSLANRWAYDGNCRVSWLEVNVVYTFRDASGELVNVVLTEDTALTRVMNMTLQKGLGSYSVSKNSHSATGYSFYTGGYTFLYAYAYWYVPAVSSCPTSNQCEFGIWTGLSSFDDGHTGFVQGGSESDYNCSTQGGCQANYRLWYQWYDPNNPFTAPVYGPNIHANDNVGTSVSSQALYGGNINYYNIYVDDYTTSQVWSSTNQYFGQMGTPYVGDFMAEIPGVFGVHIGLPQFSSVTMQGGQVYFNGAYRGIYYPYSLGGYTKWFMVNGPFPGTQNIGISSVTTSNSFTMTWITSQYT